MYICVCKRVWKSTQWGVSPSRLKLGTETAALSRTFNNVIANSPNYFSTFRDVAPLLSLPIYKTSSPNFLPL